MIKAIETVYKGYRFRSRLEARWAVFFDALGIKWEYENEGYDLGGTWYLPDFRLILPNGDVLFAEVKQEEVDNFLGEHINKCRELSDRSDRSVVLLTGVPAYRMYNCFAPHLARDSFQAAFFRDYGNYVVIADDYWFGLVKCNEQTGALEFPFDHRRASKAFGQKFVDAVLAARQARFEHGEHP